jgi:catechol 2,3-dioxygenase-like lactoylglutathione lyase family enzyme
MPLPLLRFFALAFAAGIGLCGQTRPPIVGVAHIALRTDDLSAARKFYGNVLGYDEGPSGAKATSFKVNDHQYIEVVPGSTGPDQDRLIDIAFETTNAKQLRDYLASKGVKVSPQVDRDADGNATFGIDDPDGHRVQFIQYMPESLHSRELGKHLSPNRVSDRIIHVGVIVKDRAAADALYRDVLGFKLQWYGGMKDDRTDWVSMRVPEGSDWIEYMLNVNNPSPKTRGVMHHLALGVPSVAAGYETVTNRGLAADKPKIGRDGKWQLNLYDPNLTRAELMEPKPVETPCCSPILTQ